MRLTSPQELRQRLPLSEAQRHFVSGQRDEEKLVIIAGPCSIHDLASAREYAHKLSELAHRVGHACEVVMRVYLEKARSSLGWKGFIYDPTLDGSCSIEEGLFSARQFLLELAEMRLRAATEFVDPLSAAYFHDLISWGFIGARTCASQPHRQLASYLRIPIGFKNYTDGNIDDAINGMIAARSSHTFLYVDAHGHLASVESEGNSGTYLVLRGSHESPNFSSDCVQNALIRLRSKGLAPRVIIDCAHGNCQKDYLKQKEVFYSILEQIHNGNSGIIGIMLESHLKPGNQHLTEDPSSLDYAVSITDPCIDWETTEELILAAAAALQPSRGIY